jgi:3-hydroxyisobutyrate dehydrogenase
MGHGMATSALRAGIQTMVWNRNHEAPETWPRLGANVAQPLRTRRGGAIVVTMVTDADAVISVVRDEGVLAALAPGAILVQMSTIGVAGIERVAAMVAAERPDVILLDAPVSGSKDPAEHGQLTIFASGPDEARPRVTPSSTRWASARSGPATSGLDSTQARSQHVARLWGRSGYRLCRTRSGSRARDREGGWTPSKATRSCLLGRKPSCNGSPKGEFSAQFALSLALKDVRLAEEAAGDRLGALACLADEWQQAVDPGSVTKT